MRLICPRCGAQYEIDDSLIPENGREVECSSCENIWFQHGRLRMPAAISAVVEGPEPSANQRQPDADMHDMPIWDEADSETAKSPDIPAQPRPLPEDVMGILRDEAAHFRAAHPAISETLPPDTEDEDDQPAPVKADAPPPQENVPTRPIDRVQPAEDSISTTPITAAPDSVAADTAAAETASAIVAAAAPAAATHPVDDSAVVAAPAAPAQTVRPKRRGFGSGFVIGLLIAAVLFGLYIAAPHAGEGVWGDILRSIRANGDAAHHWIHAQIENLRT